MASYNRVIMLGNLTRDPETRYTPGQTPICTFGIAATRQFRGRDENDREETCFVDCICFGRQAEVAQKYLKKGRMVHVDGRLKYDTWEDKQTKAKRGKHSISVENFQMIDPRRARSTAAGPEDRERAAEMPESDDADGPVGPVGDEIPDDTIPF
jgi:single-strand DNA-binding protein